MISGLSRAFGDPGEAAVNDTTESWLTAEEIAARLKISRAAVYRLKIPRYRIGKGSIRYREAEVDKWIEGQRDGVVTFQLRHVSLG